MQNISSRLIISSFRNFVLIFSFTGLVNRSYAQGSFEKIYGTPSYDIANAVEKTSDQGFILIGESGPSMDTCTADIGVVKCDADGNIQWTENYSTPGCDQGTGITQTPDQGYIITGLVIDTPDISHMLLMKIDSVGQIEWQYLYSSNEHDTGDELYPLPNGGYLVAGYRYNLDHYEYDLELTRFDADGTVLWSKVYLTLTSSEYGYIQICDNGNGTYFLTCTGWDFSSYPTNDNFYVLHVDSSGNVITSKEYGNSNKNEKGWGMFKINNNQYWIIGTGGPQFHTDALLLQVDSLGNLLWGKVYSDGTYASDESSVTSFSYIPEFGLYVCGFDAFYDPYTFIIDKGDAFLFQVSDDGVVNWWKDYGSPEALYWEEFERMKITNDGYLLLAGSRTIDGNYYDQVSWDMYVTKTNKYGVDGCETNKTVTVTDWTVDVTDISVVDSFVTLDQTPANYSATPEITSVTLCSEIPTGNEEMVNENKISLFPNPADDKIMIENSAQQRPDEIKFFDLPGKEAVTKKLDGGSVSISDLPSGMYLYRLYAKDGSVIKTGKLYVQHGE